MEAKSDWRVGLGATSRFENVQKIQKSIQKDGTTSNKDAQKAAFAAETEAYQNSASRDVYDTVCNAIIEIEATQEVKFPPPSTPGIVIGPFPDCHHLASGLISEVYRSHAVALKVITETRNMEPHNPSREIKILKHLVHPSIIQLIETSKDQEGRRILVFPYMPLTLANAIDSNTLTLENIHSHFKDLFSALTYLHSQNIIHRDVKPSNLLLASASGPAHLADFGTAWHPVFSLSDESPQHKVLEVGTTCYRAPETLFGNRAYTASLDIWSAGTMLAECVRGPPKALFESRGTEEDGNQLGLILSMFKTLGTPTKETWPEAVHFTTPPFEWYQEFPGRSWEELLPNVDVRLRDLVARMVCYESTTRITAEEALNRIRDISG